MDILAAFASFIVCEPQSLDTTKTTNTVNYAEQVISSVKGQYSSMHGRLPGLSEGSLGGKQWLNTLNEFRKLAPGLIPSKRPLLQPDLRRIRGVMNLKYIHDYRTMWSMCLAQWQGVMRCGYLVKQTVYRATVWDPSKESHRGIIRIEILRDDRGNRAGVKLVLVQKPSKTDPAGERGFEKGFFIYRTAQ